MTADVIKRAIEGDLPAIEQLCSSLWEPVYRFLYFKVQNREEAEDITQETFVKTLTYLQKHNIPQDNLLGFMKTVAQNIMRDRWRKKQRRGVMVDLDTVNIDAAAIMDEQTLITQRLQIESALAQLNRDQRTILNLRIIQGYSVADTAKLTGKTEAAVRTTQYRALQALGKLLDDRDLRKEG